MARSVDKSGMRAIHAWRTARAAVAEWDAVLSESLADQSLTLREFEVLDVLLDMGDTPATQKSLASAIDLSQSALSRLILGMVSKSLLSREQTVDDARSALLLVTPRGRARYEGARPAIARAARLLTEPLPIVASKPVEQFPAPSSGDGVLGLGESTLTVSGDVVRLSDAIHVREALEPHMLIEASQHRTEEDIADCRVILAQMATTSDRFRYYLLDWELHERLAVIGRNDVLRSTYIDLLNMLRSSVVRVLPAPNDENYFRRRVRIHEEVVDAVESGSIPRVRQAAAAHRFLVGAASPSDAVADVG